MTTVEGFLEVLLELGGDHIRNDKGGTGTDGMIRRGPFVLPSPPLQFFFSITLTCHLDRRERSPNVTKCPREISQSLVLISK
jgi:hypothetical protein